MFNYMERIIKFRHPRNIGCRIMILIDNRRNFQCRLKFFFLSISNEIFIRKLWTRRRFKQNLSGQRDICHMLVKDRFTRRNNWVPYYTCVLRRMTRVAVDPLILRSQSNWPARPGFPAPYMSLSSYRGWHRYLLECLNPQLHLMQRKSHIHFGLEVSCRFPLILFTGRLKNLKWKGVAATIAASITQWVFSSTTETHSHLNSCVKAL